MLWYCALVNGVDLRLAERHAGGGGGDAFRCAVLNCYCSETTLTGESWFHISTPLGIEPRSLMTGSKRVVHWTSETWCECIEVAGSPQGSPQQWTMSVVKPEGGPAANVKPGQQSCVRSSGIITLSARRPSNGLG